jgi:N-acetylglucosaminyldiphosphoundecaprenol N-acetyl-beta-D-mannosaminyltransferase
LEWFFRLMMEPHRLWQRYLLGNFIFVSLVIKQKIVMMMEGRAIDQSL